MGFVTTISVWSSLSFYLLQARIQRGGGAGGARPPLFVPNSLKSPQNWPKKCWEQSPETTAPPPFSNPGSAPVLYHGNHFYALLMQIIRVIYGRHLACLGLDLDYIGPRPILILAAIRGNAVNRCSNLGGDYFQNFGAWSSWNKLLWAKTRFSAMATKSKK